MQIAPGIYSMGQDEGGHVHAYLLDDGTGLTLLDTLYDDDANVVLSDAWCRISIGSGAFGTYQFGVTLGSSHVERPWRKPGPWKAFRCGMPRKPMIVAKNARTASTPVIENGDSCAFLAASLRSLPANTRK